MLNILDFYKNNKQDIYEQYGKPISDLLYSTEHLSPTTTKVLVARIDELRIYIKDTKYAKYMIFRYLRINYTYPFFTTLICTANNVYINSQIAGIKLTDCLSAYILPSCHDNSFETTVLIVNDNQVVATGILKNDSIIWKKQLCLTKTYFTEVDILDNPKKFTDQIISNIVLLNLNLNLNQNKSY